MRSIRPQRGTLGAGIETFGEDFRAYPSDTWGWRDWVQVEARYQPLGKTLPAPAPTRSLQGVVVADGADVRWNSLWWGLLRPGDHGKRRGLRLCARPAGPRCTPSTGPPGPSSGPFASGGSCLSGAAISEGRLFYGSGYTWFFGTPNNKLYSFGLPG